MKVQLPKSGFFKRMRIYFSEMYPIPTRIFSSIIICISFVSFLLRVHSVQAPIFSLYTLLGIWNVFALMLILRLMDELKDKDIDFALFHHRPLPSGRVLESDITFSLIVIITFYLAANLLAVKVFWMALFVLGYSLLMFKYFFIPHILRKYLLLNVATHNPFFPITFIYLLILFSVGYGLPLKDINWQFSLLMIVAYWAMFFSWEISRKIRSHEEENAYVTYSQIFGSSGAVLVASGSQIITLGIGLYFYWVLSLSGIFLTILLTGYVMTVWGYVRFLLNPNPVTSKLKPFAERYIFTVLIAHFIEHGLLI